LSAKHRIYFKAFRRQRRTFGDLCKVEKDESMFTWQVKTVIAVALLTLLTGLTMLALPKPHGGPLLLQWDPDHSLSLADIMGLGLSAVGTVAAWVTGLVWERRRL